MKRKQKKLAKLSSYFAGDEENYRKSELTPDDITGLPDNWESLTWYLYFDKDDEWGDNIVSATDGEFGYSIHDACCRKYPLMGLTTEQFLEAICSWDRDWSELEVE